MYNPKIHNRKTIRLKEYDYAKEGMYFITICTQNRKNILSEIEYVWAGFHARPQCKLTQIGNVVHECIKEIRQHCENVQINEYIIMPNHIHMIIEQGGHGNPPLHITINKIKSFTTRNYNLINNTKYVSLWQRNYYEHIIRDEKEYFKICEYIEQNPYNWKKDKYYIE